MGELAPSVALPAMTEAAIEGVRRLAALDSERPQVDLDTQHVLHGGMYLRTVRLPPWTRMTGALIKIATTVIVQGDAAVWLGEESRFLLGYNVIPASARRKQAFFAFTETFITMVFPTDAKTIEEAERKFTEEASDLASRRADAKNVIVITGE